MKSDNSICIVPKLSGYPNNKTKSNEILNWLLSRDIVKPNVSDCVLGSENGYAISEGAKIVSVFPGDLPYRLITNGLEITIGRAIFAGPPDEIICPACKENIVEDEWNVSDWAEYRSDNMLCPKCKQESEISTYIFAPEWGFSDLGFTFWNWSEFTAEFIQEFKNKLGCEITIVYCHL